MSDAKGKSARAALARLLDFFDAAEAAFAFAEAFDADTIPHTDDCRYNNGEPGTSNEDCECPIVEQWVRVPPRASLLAPPAGARLLRALSAPSTASPAALFAHSALQRFLNTWGPHCGAPRAVFEGQLRAVLTEALEDLEAQRVARLHSAAREGP